MNTRPLIHIGYPKSASTWLQEAFFPHVDNANLVPKSAVVETFMEAGALSFDPDGARRRLRAVAPGRMLLSFENLSGYPHNGGMRGALSKDLACRLHRTLPDADVVALIRRQTDILAASYAQYVKQGGTHPPDRYLFPRDYRSHQHTRPDKNPRFELDHFAYLPLLQLYRRLFGRDRVHVFLYEAFNADQAAFIRDFCARLDLRCPHPLATHHYRNSSPPAPVLRLVRSVNLFTAGRVLDKSRVIHIPGAYWLGRGIGRVLSRLLAHTRRNGLSGLLPEHRVRQIEEYYAASNVQLAAEFDLPLAQYGYALHGIANSTAVRPRLDDLEPLDGERELMS